MPADPAARPPDAAAARLATRLAFLVAGFAVACWAPLIPFSKARLGASDALMGTLLLALGAGSIGAMQVAGAVTARLGARPTTLAGGAGLVLLLPMLALPASPLALGALLFLFGGALGTLEVGMNVHAVEIEAREGRPLMSGFHGLFSVGGVLGSGLMTAVLSAGGSGLAGTLLAAVLMAAAMLATAPRLAATTRTERPPLLVRPRGIVVLLAGLAALTFLSEGAVLDWGALLLTGGGLAAPAAGGVGYGAFAAAMTAGRLGGDAVVARLGDRRTMVGGGLLTVAGFGAVLAAPSLPVAVAGFVVVGLGAANTVPILFRRAGAQAVMPASLAVAALTSVGYAGVLAGPALIGFVANATGLRTAFALLAAALLLVPLAAPAATRRAG